VSKIDMSKLLKREINGDFGRSLGLEAIAELESMETNSGARIGALSDRTHEIFARHWFHYLAHTFRLNSRSTAPCFAYIPRCALRLVSTRWWTSFGTKATNSVNTSTKRLRACMPMPGGVVSRTWVGEQAMEEPISVIDPVRGQITLLEDTGCERVVRAKGSTRLTIGRIPRNVLVIPDDVVSWEHGEIRLST
jgi:hypothetical protein